MVQIYEDRNGLVVRAVDSSNDEDPEWGHEYEVSSGRRGSLFSRVEFQWGVVPERGVNGHTNESMIAILIHRLGVLNEKFPCEQNELAIGNLRTALALLEARTADRVARGVEGKETA